MYDAIPLIVLMAIVIGVGGLILYNAMTENEQWRKAEQQRQKPLTPEQMADKEFWYRAQARMLDAEGEYKLKTAELEDIEQFVSSRKKPEKSNAKRN